MRLFQSQTERHYIPGTKPISRLINYLQLKLIKSSEYHKRGKEAKIILSCIHMAQLLSADSCSGKQMEHLFPDIVGNNNSIVLHFKVAKQSKYVPTVMPDKTELQPLSTDHCLTRTLSSSLSPSLQHTQKHGPSPFRCHPFLFLSKSLYHHLVDYQGCIHMCGHLQIRALMFSLSHIPIRMKAP